MLFSRTASKQPDKLTSSSLQKSSRHSIANAIRESDVSDDDDAEIDAAEAIILIPMK
jgi:hypothetical protein